MDVRSFDHLDALPEGYRNLFDHAGRADFFSSLAWYRSLFLYTTSPGQALRLYGAEQDGHPVVALVLRTAAQNSSRWRELDSCSNAFTTRFTPVATPGTQGVLEGLTAIAHVIRTERPPWDYVRLGALPGDEPFYEYAYQAFRNAGFWTQPFQHFGNWYEELLDVSFETYLRGISKSLRQIWNRARRPNAPTFHLVTKPEEVEWGVRAYNEVYASSWKEPESFPTFMPDLMRNAAAVGALRLGVLTYGNHPIAAQLWLVSAEHCTIFKVAHDERHKHLSPGTVLTLHMLNQLLTHDSVKELDFGCGDDPYKRRWMTRRRVRKGIAAFNPTTLPGLLHGTAHICGSPIKRQLLSWRTSTR